MRTPRFFLGIFALALLMPLLLLACGGSDEPTDGPSSERAAARPPLAETSPETDREALVALYNATDGENWENSDNWLSDAPIGEWHGVTTNADGRVTLLNLSRNKLSGEIPAELGNLFQLERLNLTVNELSGEIPAELGSLSNLIRLYIGGTELSGEIPAELGRLSNLRVLNLSFTNLSGEIPAELGNLSNLRVLNLSFTELSGEIPAELGNLSNLIGLVLNDNKLSGCVPGSLYDGVAHGDGTNLGGMLFC